MLSCSLLKNVPFFFFFFFLKKYFCTTKRRESKKRSLVFSYSVLSTRCVCTRGTFIFEIFFSFFYTPNFLKIPPFLLLSIAAVYVFRRKKKCFFLFQLKKMLIISVCVFPPAFFVKAHCHNRALYVKTDLFCSSLLFVFLCKMS